jgi:hypothetical protein
MTLSIMPHSIFPLSIMTLSIMTLSIKTLISLLLAFANFYCFYCDYKKICNVLILQLRGPYKKFTAVNLTNFKAINSANQ